MAFASVPAPGALRDAFLTALDAGDSASALSLAHYLTGSANALPSTTCVQLGVPPGSSYGAAARSLLEGAASLPVRL